MSVFTVSVQELVEQDYDFGLDTYPIFSDAYRDGLNQKIIDHYRNYEIGFETDDMFRFALRRKMNEIMPYYNQLYLSEQVEFDPLQTIDFLDETDSTNENVSASESTNTNENDSKGRARVVNSETPQVHLSPDEDYATAATDTASDSTATGTGTATATGTDTATGNVSHRMTGSQGHAPQLLMAYRASLLNIDMMVIRDLATLFMQIWNVNDTHTDQGRYYGYGFGYYSI